MKKYEMFCRVYDIDYPKSTDIIFDFCEPFYAESYDEAQDKCISVVVPLLKTLFPENSSSTGVTGEEGTWTFTDVM